MAGILQIGASVNVAELKAGMEEAAGSVRSQAGQMSAAFQGLAAESEASTEQIAANWVAVAEASLAARAAIPRRLQDLHWPSGKRRLLPRRSRRP
jgi:hypothetical protein